jgi:signal transduction histidine kinase/PAS domain-containing protein
MKIKGRLNLNAFISLGAVLFIILSLGYAYREESIATRNMGLVEELRIVAFERILLRDDYLQYSENRAKIQWLAKNDTMRALLDEAGRRFADSDDRDLLREARKDFDATVDSFAGYMEHQKGKKGGWANDGHITKAEAMLVSQTFLKAYSLTDSIIKLNNSIRQKAAGVRKRSILTVVFFLIAGITAIIANSAALNRLLNRRIAALAKGVEVIGGGDLDHRIDVRGDDELSALALGTNEMAGRLKTSYISVEDLRREIVERRKAEENLAQTMRLNQVLLDAFPCVALLLRPRTREIVASNAAAVKAGAVPGAYCYSSWRKREDPCPWCLAPAVWETGKAQHLEVEAGGISWDAHWVPVSEDVYMHFAFDFTDRKRAEKEKRTLEERVRQSRKMESLGVLAGGIAHDFNNILMTVLGHSEMAWKSLPPASPVCKNLSEITAATHRAAHLCRQMLAYAGKASFALERVGLGYLVEGMASLLKTAVSYKAVLRLDLESVLPSIEADPDQLRQVVMSLVMNASEAIGDRGGSITVSVGSTLCDAEFLRMAELEEKLAPGRYVRLEVTDTGIGMDAETQARIFEPFFTTKFIGRGLSLPAVLGIVHAHKGAVTVRSEPGEGSTFRVFFPALGDGEPAGVGS